MTLQTTKISLKFGDIQVEYDGNVAELTKYLPELLETISRFSAPKNGQDRDANEMDLSNVVPIRGDASKMEATTNMIASKMGCNSGPDLIKAAALQLTLVQGKGKFTRLELVKEMKTSSYHRITYEKNLSVYLKTLFKDFLNEAQKNTYSIMPPYYY